MYPTYYDYVYSQQKTRSSADHIVFVLQHFGHQPYEALTYHCQSLIDSVVGKYFLRGYRREDLEQEAHVVLAGCVNTYDPEREMPFLQYFHMQLLNHLNGLVRKETAQKRRSDREACSWDGLLENGEYQSYHPVNSSYTDPGEFVLMCDGFADYQVGLSEFETACFRRFVTGRTHAEMSAELNEPEERVRNALYRSSTKLRRMVRSRL